MRYDNNILRFYNFGHCFVTNDNGGDDNGGGGDNEPNNPPNDNDNNESVEALKKALENARNLERTLKRENEKYKKEKEERDNADKTELEKANGRVTELEERVKAYETREREAVVSSAVAESAKKHGAIYPEDVYALVKEKLELDDNGAPKNAESVVKALRETRPALFNVDNVDQNARNKDRSSSLGTDINKQIRQMTGRT